MNTSVRVASTANLTPATAEVGQTVDDVVLGPHDRLLLKDQTRSYENGVIEVQPSGAGVFVRVADMAPGTFIPAGSTVVVNEGTANADKSFVLLGIDPIRVGYDDLVFIDAVVAGAPPTGVAGGVLGGTYPNPAFAVDMATQAELNVTQAEVDAHEALTTTAHGGIVASTDPRLTDARTPTAHKTSHENAGSDEISVLGLSGLLGDAQTPLSHATSHQDGGSDEISVTGLSGLLSTAQTPAAHKTSHENGGADEVSVLGLSGLLADGQTPLAHAASHASAGSDAVSVLNLGGYPGGTGTFLRADASFAASSVTDPNPQSYSPGTFSVATEKYVIMSNHLKLTTTQRATLAGTSRLRLT